jgi:hypothetical protein
MLMRERYPSLFFVATKSSKKNERIAAIEEINRKLYILYVKELDKQNSLKNQRSKKQLLLDFDEFAKDFQTNILDSGFNFI